MLMYIGGMQITPRPTKQPSRMADPPGTRRTLSASASSRSGSVSLSRNGNGPPVAAGASLPIRNPSRIPLLTHAFARHDSVRSAVGGTDLTAVEPGLEGAERLEGPAPLLRRGTPPA